MLLSSGEQISISKLSILLNKMGYKSISLTGWQAGILKDNTNQNAIIKNIDTTRILQELKKRKIVIIAGFQGYNENLDITTLGRGGSDTSAIAIAAALKAKECYIFSDVDGVYTADPRVVPNAKKLKEITYDEMLELATLGAKVLHNRSVEMAKKYGVQLVVRSSLTTAEGTVVKEDVNMESMLVSGVAADKNTARIAVIGLKDEPGIAFKLFNALAKHNINVDIILQSIGRDGTKDISFTVAEDEVQETLNVIEENKNRITAQRIETDTTVAKVSVVGAGMMSHSGVAAKMFEALYNVGVNIKMISTSEIRVTVLIARDDVDKAMKAVHDAFIQD